jgi:tRNA (mo5U34)-methyltransferase
VVGIDVEPLFLRQAEWAAREFGLADRVRFRRAQVYDLARGAERFDLVLFMGVFYHLRYPLLGLDALTGATRRLMVFQTLTAPGDEVHPDTARPRDVLDREDFRAPGWPTMAFLEHPFAGDRTNWWAANRAGVEAMLRSSGHARHRAAGARDRAVRARPGRRRVAARRGARRAPRGHRGSEWRPVDDAVRGS